MADDKKKKGGQGLLSASTSPKGISNDKSTKPGGSDVKGAFGQSKGKSAPKSQPLISKSGKPNTKKKKNTMGFK